MEVSATQSTSSNNAANSVSKNDLLNTDQFLKLFIAELANQDPLEPIQTSELTNQLAQLSMVEQLEHLSRSMDGLLLNSDYLFAIMDSLLAVQDSLAFYSGLIGKTGVWTNSEGIQMSGTIESIILREYEYYAIIDGNEIKIYDITQVSQEVIDSGSEL